MDFYRSPTLPLRKLHAKGLFFLRGLSQYARLDRWIPDPFPLLAGHPLAPLLELKEKRATH